MTTAPQSSTAAADGLIDPSHPFAAHLRHVAAVDAAAVHQAWTPGDAPLPALRFAHPTVEHFTPLFVTRGAATDPTAPVTTAIDGFVLGPARRSLQAA